jgi:hypothetical protein
MCKLFSGRYNQPESGLVRTPTTDKIYMICSDYTLSKFFYFDKVLTQNVGEFTNHGQIVAVAGVLASQQN